MTKRIQLNENKLNSKSTRTTTKSKQIGTDTADHFDFNNEQFNRSNLMNH